MSFNEEINRINSTDLNSEENNKLFQISCVNWWCKGLFQTSKATMLIEGDGVNRICPSCRNSNENLSGGVIDNGTTEYAGERFDGKNHKVKMTMGTANASKL